MTARSISGGDASTIIGVPRPVAILLRMLVTAQRRAF